MDAKGYEVIKSQLGRCELEPTVGENESVRYLSIKAPRSGGFLGLTTYTINPEVILNNLQDKGLLEQPDTDPRASTSSLPVLRILAINPDVISFEDLAFKPVSQAE